MNYAERNPPGYDARYISSRQRFGHSGDESVEQEAPVRADPRQAAAPPTDEEMDIGVEIASEKAHIDRAITTVKKSNCDIGKLNLAQLKNYNRIKVRGENGEVRVLTDEEKQARIDRATATIKENCN